METLATTLAPAVLEDLQNAFFAMNCLEFCKHIHTLEIPDAVRSEWLRAKVMLKPSEREDAMQQSISRVMDNFWNRILESGK